MANKRYILLIGSVEWNLKKKEDFCVIDKIGNNQNTIQSGDKIRKKLFELIHMGEIFSLLLNFLIDKIISDFRVFEPKCT